ncbi:MAG: SOS response-associated peptidase [Solirubrobacterales bacterium]|nr:SOS response-associated peptidase [Solirubrobacterales bacterium]
MCGRFTLTNPNPRRLASRFDLDPDFEIDDRPRFNIAPTDPVVAIRHGESGRNEAGVLRWGLVPGHWAEKKGQRPLINARAETVATQPAFRESFAERRCLIPADGFYEWRRDPEGKQPIWFSPSGEAGGELFAFAGVWARLERNGRPPLLSCALITCPPNGTMRPVHDRMPVVLDRGAESAWIDPGTKPDDLLGLLRPAPDDALVPREVGDAVNDVRRDGPELLEPPMKLF